MREEEERREYIGVIRPEVKVNVVFYSEDKLKRVPVIGFVIYEKTSSDEGYKLIKSRSLYLGEYKNQVAVLIAEKEVGFLGLEKEGKKAEWTTEIKRRFK